MRNKLISQNKPRKDTAARRRRNLATENASTSREIRKMDQYHHYIPRFLLRRFQIGGPMSCSKRSVEFKRTGVDPETILYYDLAKKTLETRSIATSFGTTNLYRDANNLRDVDELEDKLAKLESKAATILAKIHSASRDRRVTLIRSEVEDLRKFLFLMHYRSTCMSAEYWDPSSPFNGLARRWIEAVKSRFDISTPAEVWLLFLRYFLDTPHAQIIEHSMQSCQSVGGFWEFALKLTSGGGDVDPNMENFQAVAYHIYADMLTLSIWQAGNNSEFVLAGNAFARGTGICLHQPHLHRIFVVGPRIAIILRNDLFYKGSRTNSTSFHEVDLSHSETQYSQPDISSKTTELKLCQERQRVEKDFTFEYTKLTTTETYALNCSILEDISPTGAITFVNRSYMLQTMREFCRSPLKRRYEKRPVYWPLIHMLINEDATTLEMQVQLTFAPPVQLPYSREIALPTSGDQTSTSRYNICYRYHLCFLKAPHYQRLIGQLAESFLDVASPPSSTFRPQPEADLVGQLSEEDSDKVFQFMKEYVSLDNNGVGELSSAVPGNIELSIVTGTATIGFLAIVAKVRHDLLSLLIPDVQLLRDPSSEQPRSHIPATTVNGVTVSQPSSFRSSSNSNIRVVLPESPALTTMQLSTDNETSMDDDVFTRSVSLYLGASFYFQPASTAVVSMSQSHWQEQQKLHSIFLHLAVHWDAHRDSPFDPAYELYNICHNAGRDELTCNFISEYHRIVTTLTERIFAVMTTPAASQSSLPSLTSWRLVETMPKNVGLHFFGRINVLLRKLGYEALEDYPNIRTMASSDDLFLPWLGRAVGVGFVAEILGQRPETKEFFLSIVHLPALAFSLADNLNANNISPAVTVAFLAGTNNSNVYI